MEERLNILKESGLITNEIFIKLKNMIEGFKNEYQIALTEDNAGMMITHLSQAMMRVNNGEKIKTPDSFVVDEIKSNENYQIMIDMYKKICEFLDFEFPSYEKWFVYVHIGNILMKEKND